MSAVTYNRMADSTATPTVDKGVFDIISMLPQLVPAILQAATKSAPPPPSADNKGLFDVISILPQVIAATVQAASKSAPTPPQGSDKGLFDVVSLIPRLVPAILQAATKGPVGAPTGAAMPPAPPVKGWDQILTAVANLAVAVAQSKSGTGDKDFGDILGGIVHVLPTVVQIAGMIL